jgi:hypothetical protein
LLADDSGTQGSVFEVTAKTTGAPAHVALASSPIGGRVRIEVATTSAPATLELGAAFEGKLLVVGHQAALERRDAQDPAGRGRERAVKMIREIEKPGVVEGVVGWGGVEETSSREKSAIVSTDAVEGEMAKIVL